MTPLNVLLILIIIISLVLVFGLITHYNNSLYIFFYQHNYWKIFKALEKDYKNLEFIKASLDFPVYKFKWNEYDVILWTDDKTTAIFKDGEHIVGSFYVEKSRRLYKLIIEHFNLK